jgi:Flp pilus assembly protein TadD
MAAVAAWLTGITIVAYAGVWRNGFIGWDDTLYVTENPQVLSGLTMRGIAWAFTTTHASNWHPITWLSHMLDVELFGVNPAFHHAASVVFHIINALLLFVVLHRMTGAAGRSVFVATLFAIHPLHVESVAWAAERKDVLSGLFWMLTMLAYVAYVDHPSRRRYALILVTFALGLMSKPMLVTLPFVLLLLDVWPLGRAERVGWYPLVRQKLPLFGLVLANSVTTFLAQKYTGAVSNLIAVPLSARIANAFLSYVRYIGKAIWPTKLAALYPFQGPIDILPVVLAAVALIGVTIAVFVVRSRRPYLAVGWFWYLGTLVPVIGLVQVGHQAMADRYTYIPLIGVFVAVAWGANDLLATWPGRRATLATVAAVIVIGCVAVTQHQVTVWSNGVSVWEHTLAVTKENTVAHTNLGYELAIRGRLEEASAHYRAALRIAPRFVPARQNLGLALLNQGKTEEAVQQYALAVRLQPANARLRTDYGLALANTRRDSAAITQYEAALRLQPGLTVAHIRLATALIRHGRTEEAIAHYRRAIAIGPPSAEAHNNLGAALATQGKIREAIAEFSEALRLMPNYTDARNNLARATRAGTVTSPRP